MKRLHEFSHKIQFLLTDIDDTLTDEGRLGPAAYSALWKLQNSGVQIIPITGRPAGWCEMITRMWPVSGVVGENGGFYFRYHNKKMHRYFLNTPVNTSENNREKLSLIQDEILREVPGADVASDQFCRLMDLAIDFCEDVPRLPAHEVDRIVSIFKRHGAQAKVSSIHVNGWFGTYNKVTTSLLFLEKEFGISNSEAKKICAFSGDSPNDEPMFEFFPNSFAVANISEFVSTLKHLPTYVSEGRGGEGFSEIASQILKIRQGNIQKN